MVPILTIKKKKKPLLLRYSKVLLFLLWGHFIIKL